MSGGTFSSKAGEIEVNGIQDEDSSLEYTEVTIRGLFGDQVTMALDKDAVKWLIDTLQDTL